MIPSYHTLVILANEYKDKLKELNIEDTLAHRVPSLQKFKDAKIKMKKMKK
jgi:hypothetical protein